MFKLVKNQITRILKSHIGDSYWDANLINKNPTFMKLLIKEDSSYIKYVFGKGATKEVFELAVEKGASAEDIFEFVRQNKSILKYHDIAKKLCAINGRYFAMTPQEGITFEAFIKASNHKEEGKNYNYKYENSFSLAHVPFEEIKKFIEYDGNLIEYVSHYDLSPELLDIALNNPDPKKVLKIEKNSNIFSSAACLEYLCKLDGRYLAHAYSSDVTSNLITMAMNHPDPEKRLTVEMMGKSNLGSFDYRVLKKVCKEDPRWFDYVNLKTMTRKEIIDNLKSGNLKVNKAIVKIYQDDDEVINYMVEAIKQNNYNEEELDNLLRIEHINYHFTKTKLFEYVYKKICENLDIDYEWFKYYIVRSIRINDNILCNLEYRILDKRFHSLYKENDFEMVTSITSYNNIQQSLIDIGYPQKKDGTVDNELGQKQLELFSHILKVATTDKSGNRIKEWIPYFSKILYSFEKYQVDMEYFARHIDELDDDLLKTLTNHIVGEHSFKIKTIDDLKNYDEIRKKWVDKKIKSFDYLDVRYAVIEKIFGLGSSSIDTLSNCYGCAVLQSPDKFPRDLVDFFKTINLIKSANNIEVLKKVAASIDDNKNLRDIDTIHLQTSIRKQLLRAYNTSLFQISNKQPDATIKGIKLYKAAGEKGNKKFGIMLSALGAYIYLDTKKKDFNYKDDWNRPTIDNHGICCSYISNSNLGVADYESAVLGFTDFEDGALLLGGPRDIYSNNTDFDIIGYEEIKSEYYLPDDMIDNTRHLHNEIVFERKNGNEKRQPSYIVLICDDLKKAQRLYDIKKNLGMYKKNGGNASMNDGDALNAALNAAKDFNAPIVVVEKRVIAKQQFKNITNSLKDFVAAEELNRDDIKKYFHDIITVFENNNSGQKEKITKEFFSLGISVEIMDTIKSKIKRTMRKNPELALIMLEELEDVIDSEKEKDCLNERKFDIDSTIYFCQNMVDDLQNESNYPTFIGMVLDEEIDNKSDCLEYNACVKGKVDEQQYNINNVYGVIKQAKTRIIVAALKIDDNLENRREIENILLFSTIIGKKIDLSPRDMDILLTASIYSKEDNIDKVINNISSTSNKNDLKMIRTILEYQSEVIPKAKEEGYIKLREICKKNGILNEEDIDRVITISNCLKDAKEIEKTRFFANSQEFTDQNELHYPASKRLIRFGMQVNERQAYAKISEITSKNPEQYHYIVERIKELNSPKLINQELIENNVNSDEKEVKSSHVRK